MYDTSLTRIALPSKEYLYLLGVAISVFSSNNSFIIENIIQTDHTQSWYELVDKTSGSLKPNIDKTISQVAGKEIEDHFQQICEMRNRIMHAFRITSKDGEQILATKDKEENGGEQFEINETYLKKFITENDKLAQELEDYRDSFKKNKMESEKN